MLYHTFCKLKNKMSSFEKFVISLQHVKREEPLRIFLWVKRGRRVSREDDFRDEEERKGKFLDGHACSSAACSLSTDLFSTLWNNRPLLSIVGLHKRVLCASWLNALLITLTLWPFLWKIFRKSFNVAYWVYAQGRNDDITRVLENIHALFASMN